MIHVGIHLDPVATLRDAGLGREPDLLAAGHAAMVGGADLVIVRVRSDGHGAKEADLRHLREALAIPLHVEFEATPAAVALVRAIKPDHACLVPAGTADRPITAGLDVRSDAGAAAAGKALEDLRQAGIPASVLVEPDEATLVAANGLGADAVELLAARYGSADTDPRRVVAFRELARAAAAARALGMRVHVGHGLDHATVSHVAALEDVESVHAGFAVVARALFLGLQTATAEFRVRATRARADEAVMP